MKKLLLVIAFAIGYVPVNAQFVNGSFETTTANCDFNISNLDFNSKMTACYAFGIADQLDIIENSCQYGGAHEGSFLVGLAVAADNTETDAFSLKLATPLVAGNTYQLTFYNKKTASFDANEL